MAAVEIPTTRDVFEPSVLTDYGDADALTAAVSGPSGSADGPYAS